MAGDVVAQGWGLMETSMEKSRFLRLAYRCRQATLRITAAWMRRRPKCDACAGSWRLPGRRRRGCAKPCLTLLVRLTRLSSSLRSGKHWLGRRLMRCRPRWPISGRRWTSGRKSVPRRMPPGMRPSRGASALRPNARVSAPPAPSYAQGRSLTRRRRRLRTEGPRRRPPSCWP